MSKHYKNVIGILQTEQNWKQICVEIAKTNPSLICKHADNGETTRYVKEAKEKGKISAIKMIRKEKGLDLLTAKRLIESLTDDYKVMVKRND